MTGDEYQAQVKAAFGDAYSPPPPGPLAPPGVGGAPSPVASSPPNQAQVAQAFGSNYVPPASTPISPGFAQLGAGLQMPTTSSSLAPAPPAPSGPKPGAVALPPLPGGSGFVPLPRAVGADLRANERDAADVRQHADEARRQSTIAQLEAMGAKPGTADRDATKIDEHSRGVANPFSAAHPQGGAGAGGPAAPAFNATAAGYAALGDNPNDPRQVAANRAAALAGQNTAAMMDQHAAAAYQASRTQQAMIAGQADQQRLDAIDEQKKRQEAAVYTDASRQQYQQMAQDLASQKIDPDAIYRGAEGGVRRATSAIAVALGAIGATYGHTENFAQKIVEQQIQNSIEAQKANMANKSRGVENAKGAYEMLRQQGMDDAQARNATRALGYGAAARDAEAIQAGLNGDEKKRATEDLKQDFLQRQAQAEQQHTIAANAKGFELAEQRRKEAVAAANAGKGADEAAAKVDQGAAVASTAAEDVLSQGDDVAGRGLLARGASAISGGAFESSDKRQTDRELTDLARFRIKQAGGKPNEEAVKNELRGVRDSEDARRFALETRRLIEAQKEAARRTKGKGGASRGGGADEEGEP